MAFIQRNVVAVARNEEAAGQLHRCWFPTVEERSGRQFMTIVSGEYRFKKFIDNKMDMFDAIVKARSEAVEEALLNKFGESADPSMDRSLPNRRRAEMIDEIEDVLHASVQTDDGTNHKIYVLKPATDGSKLSIELTNENVDLLLMKPKDAKVTNYVPSIGYENVKWCGARSSVYCKYYDADKTRTIRKSFPVTPSEDESVYQERVDSMAKLCNDFYQEKHTARSEDVE